MIKIQVPNIDEIAEEYYQYLIKWLDIGKTKGRFMTKADSIIQSLSGTVKTNFESQVKIMKLRLPFRSFVLASPDILLKLKAEMDANTSKEFTQLMTWLYDEFFKSKTPDGEKISYWLAKRLNIRVCPYCNRNYTFTVTRGATRTRPQFDHFYPKSKNPYFALCFYNLIPSCPICNKAKLEEEITYNPYKDGFPADQSFKVSNKENDLKLVTPDSNLKVEIANISKNKNVEKLLLNELYEQHEDLAKEILFKARAYNDAFYNSVLASFQGAGYSNSYIDNLIWGSYIDEQEEGKKPFSKFTRDILKQIGIR